MTINHRNLTIVTNNPTNRDIIKGLKQQVSESRLKRTKDIIQGYITIGYGAKRIFIDLNSVIKNFNQ
jgi:hypothetical protein